ncbi:hypothetical protein BH11PSE10_BH11PSE10_06660 [soil metagenome]
MRRFGRFELRALLSKTSRSMLWLVLDTRSQQEMMLALPRLAPNSPAAAEHWLKMANIGSRVVHPNLAHVVEVGLVDQWPFVAYDRALGETLDERLARLNAPLPLDAADWVCQYLQGLAFAHEAGHAHRDVQASTLIINAANQVRVLGLEVAQEVFPATADFSAVTRRAVRESAQEDLLCVGLLLHRLLGGQPVLGQGDLLAVMQQMQPFGHELVRLGFETPHPIPEPLRAICNRSTDRQERQRYQIARSFLRALDGWRTAASDGSGGAVALLIDRIQRVGHLPSTTTALHRVTQSPTSGAQHTSALSELVLKDMALSLELLRRVNNALKQQGVADNGTVLNMQRAIAMLGLNGLEQAARGLKPWPGPLNESNAAALRSLMGRVQRAGQIAQALRPAGYDPAVVYLITLMQNLGRLLLQYHFPDDAAQMAELMRAPEPTADQPHPPTMSEQAAAYAVLGCDLETLGAAVARYWNLGDELIHMIRRQPPNVAVRATDSDADVLRLTCSLANELVDVLNRPETAAQRRQALVELVTRRYARPLQIGLRDVLEALQPQMPEGANKSATAAVPGPSAPAVNPPKASALRSKLTTGGPAGP